MRLVSHYCQLRNICNIKPLLSAADLEKVLCVFISFWIFYFYILHSIKKTPAISQKCSCVAFNWNHDRRPHDFNFSIGFIASSIQFTILLITYSTKCCTNAKLVSTLRQKKLFFQFLCLDLQTKGDHGLSVIAPKQLNE